MFVSRGGVISPVLVNVLLVRACSVEKMWKAFPCKMTKSGGPTSTSAHGESWIHTVLTAYTEKIYSLQNCIKSSAVF